MHYWNKLSAGVVEPPFWKGSRPAQTDTAGLMWQQPCSEEEAVLEDICADFILEVFEERLDKALGTWSMHTAD